MTIIERIRKRQARMALPLDSTPPAHHPEMLYIGCVDARLDPIEDIGIEKGTALIFRNIGALVGKSETSQQGAVAGADMPFNVSIGAVLDFFVNHIETLGGKKKHIVVSGHTDCGGLKACWHGVSNSCDHYLPKYLENFKSAREKVLNGAKETGQGEAGMLRALEKESVRQSVRNLRSYATVNRALEEGRVELHGWVIDTATQRIMAMNPETLEFEPLAA